MGIIDILLAIGIFGGAVYTLYRSVWIKKGHCPGCNGGYSLKKIKKYTN